MLIKIYSALICFGIFIFSTNLVYATEYRKFSNDNLYIKSNNDALSHRNLLSFAEIMPAKQINWGAYMRDVEKRIKKHWFPPRGEHSERVKVFFRVGRKGELLSFKIAQSSGNPKMDDSVKKAIKASQPFKPLPPKFKGEYVDIDFTFDYNVFHRASYDESSDEKF